MKLKNLRSKCKKKSDELFMDCGSNDVTVYAQACHIKHRKITIPYLKMLIAVSELGKAKETRKRMFKITYIWCSARVAVRGWNGAKKK